LIRLLLLILSLAASILLTPRHAAAAPEDLAAGLAQIAKDSFNDTIAGVDAIARSGAAHSAALIEALRERRLLIDTVSKKVFYRDAAGAIRDAENNAVIAAPPADLSAVRLNNRVRGAANAALGTLS